MKQARNYQLETKDYTFQQIRKGTKSLIQCMATGLGKTYTAAITIKEVPGRVLWLTHTEELIEQSALSVYLELTDLYDQVPNIIANNGIIGTLDQLDKGLLHTNIIDPIGFKKTIGVIKQHRMDTSCKVSVASIQTIHRRLEKFQPDHFDMIIVDECHLAMAKTWTKTLDYFPDAIKIGLTATPERLDGASLGDLFEEFACNYDIKYGIDNGWLVPINAKRIATKLDISKVKSLGGEFSSSDLEKVINTPARNNKIVDSYLEYCKDQPFIGFGVDVKHCIELTKTFNDRGVKTSFIVGDEKLCPNRKERIDGFRSQEFMGLINVTILTAGFDYDRVATIIHARPTQSKTIYLQATGRGTRILSGVIEGLQEPEQRLQAIQQSAKPILTLLDIVDNTNRHNLINAWFLDKGKKTEEKVFISPEDKQKLIVVETARRTKLEHELEHDENVTLLGIPEHKLWNSGKNLEPATQPQLDCLERWGYDVVTIQYSKFDVAEIFAKQPATKDMLIQIKNWGYDTSSGLITRGDYDACKKDQEKRKQDKLSEHLLFHKVPFEGIS